jgi:hypothetical protein
MKRRTPSQGHAASFSSFLGVFGRHEEIASTASSSCKGTNSVFLYPMRLPRCARTSRVRRTIFPWAPWGHSCAQSTRTLNRARTAPPTTACAGRPAVQLAGRASTLGREQEQHAYQYHIYPRLDAEVRPRDDQDLCGLILDAESN